MGLNSKRNLYLSLFCWGVVLATAKLSLAQENDPNTPKPKINFCSEKLVPIPETGGQVADFFELIALEIQSQSQRGQKPSRDEIYQVFQRVAVQSFFGDSFDHDSLPEGLMDWNRVLKLDECSSLLKNVNLPTVQWTEYCLENYVPKTFSEIKTSLALATESKTLTFFKESNSTGIEFALKFSQELRNQFHVQINLKQIAAKTLKEYEKSLEKKYRHFYSETELAGRYFVHKNAVKAFDPESLSHSIWKVTHVIPPSPDYLSQKMLVDTDGIRSTNGIRKLLKIGSFDSSGTTGAYESSKLMSWAREGQSTGIESLELVQKDEGPTLIMKLYRFTEGGAVLPRNLGENIIPTSLDLVTFRCQVIGDPARKLVCNGSSDHRDGFIIPQKNS